MSQERADRLRLGHISYSNCFPVHSRFIDRPAAGDPQLIEGTPAMLNGLLAEGKIDAAPCSSIEYALHADRYSIVPDVVIGTRGHVRSILFASRVDPTELSGRTVALPTASATSVVLLRILLRERWKVTPNFTWFDQARDNPMESGADAALYIGDVALGLRTPADGLALDLGAEWLDHTGLPFAFALWQTTLPKGARSEGLHHQLVESRAYGTANRSQLANRYAGHFGLNADALDEYWDTLQYRLDPEMIEGLLTFYRRAKDAGALEKVPELRWAV